MSKALTPEPTPASWPVLNVTERRVLGVLVEKAKTTPDAYPMSLNALVNGCNQKSNRDPMLNLSEWEVEEALASAQQKGLTTRITGSRVERWRHNLYELFQVSKVELAVLAELLLRGPQTEGELRGRASRMEPIADLDALRAVLRLLAERRLVVYLGPEGRRGTTLTHGFHAVQELELARAAQPMEDALPSSPRAPTARESPVPTGQPHIDNRAQADLSELRAEVRSLQERLGQVQSSLAELTEQVGILKKSLGS